LFRHGTLSGLSDEELLARFLDRMDGSAFEAIVSLHGPMVLGICRRMLRDYRDVEDAFQATFLVLVKKAPAIRDRALLSNWLYGVAYRVANRARVQAIQRRAREFGVDQLDANADGIGSDSAEIGPVLDQELNRLPAKYREPLVLCYLEGRTHDQAAEQLRCPVGTVRSRMARGRDLLKRRLTRRGCSPVTGIVGGGVPLAFGPSVESVPTALLSSTVRAALGTAAVRAAGAASVTASILTLTQGVLTTMKLGQLTWIAMAMLATGVSASGVIAVAFAHSHGGEQVTTAEPRADEVAAAPGPVQVSSARSQSVMEGLDERLKALENKLDALLSRFPTTTSTREPAGTTSTVTTSSPSNDPFRSPAATSTGNTAAIPPKLPRPEAPVSMATTLRPDQGWTTNAPATVGTVRELETQLKLALDAFDRTDTLFQRGVISREEREQTRGRVLLATAVLQGLDDDLADELDRLRLELKKRTAELHQSVGQKDVAATVIARNRRLNERNPGVVSDYDVAKAEAEYKVAEAQIEVKKAEVEEVSLQAARANRRRERIAHAIKLSARAKEGEAVPPPVKAGY
jgi:RNA polymerase sigma factor (sigma-70 family)